MSEEDLRHLRPCGRPRRDLDRCQRYRAAGLDRFLHRILAALGLSANTPADIERQPSTACAAGQAAAARHDAGGLAPDPAARRGAWAAHL